jgi:hypothetical protein
MTHQLDFINPMFHPGLNMTCRLGQKWLQAKPGDILTICDVNGVKVGTGIAITTALTKFSALPQAWLRFEHDPPCRHLTGLAEAMRLSYGDAFNISSEVVSLLFWV